MQSSFSKYGAEISDAIQTCRDWKPADGIPSVLQQSVRTLVCKIEGDHKPAIRRRASLYKQVNREPDEDGELQPVAPHPRKPDDHNQLASLFRNLFLVRFCDALSCMSESYSQQGAICKPHIGARTCTTERVASHCRLYGKGLYTTLHSISDCSTSVGDVDSLSSSCSTASESMSADDAREGGLPPIFEFVDLLHWICCRKNLPSILKECFCDAQLINALAQICKHAPLDDTCGVLTVVRTLQRLVTDYKSSEAGCTMHVLALMSSDWINTVADRLQTWICKLLACHNGTQLVGQLVGCIGDISRDLFQNQDACATIGSSRLAFRIHAVIDEYLLSETLLWPRAVMLFADAVQAAPMADNVQLGMELSNRLRRKFAAMSSHDVGNVVSMLTLRMKSLQRKLQTENGGLPVRRPSHSCARKSMGSQNEGLLLPAVPQRRASSCKGLRSTCQQRRALMRLPGLRTI